MNSIATAISVRSSPQVQGNIFMSLAYADLGCGNRYHRERLNFDLNTGTPEVCPCNVLQGVLLPDDSCDGVFNSALLRHLTPVTVGRFLDECRRILKKGGILRIGAPLKPDLIYVEGRK